MVFVLGTKEPRGNKLEGEMPAAQLKEREEVTMVIWFLEFVCGRYGLRFGSQTVTDYFLDCLFYLSER